MDIFTNFIKPELLILIPVIYAVGAAIKHSPISSTTIPFILGVVSVFITGLWIFATTPTDGFKNILMALFASITQGILIAASSVYVNELIKQRGLMKSDSSKPEQPDESQQRDDTK